MAEASLYIGLMSGTSMDAVDAVLAHFDEGGRPTQLASAAIEFPSTLQDELLALNMSGQDELARAALAAQALVALYAQVVSVVLAKAQLTSRDIVAIGAHGQTVRHRPELGYTLQLNAPALLAELTGISVIADFRSRDVAAGGQGAPLVPLFHAGVFSAAHTRVILNLGGIANITILRPGQAPVGFDTGPANMLMDMWCLQHTGQTFDKDGAWGASAQPNAALLDLLIESEPWFAAPAPKSTGRDLFHRGWLEQRLTKRSPLEPKTVQATLRQLTVATVAQCMQRYARDVQEVLVCGGGARNSVLMSELGRALGCSVQPTDVAGINTQDVEALAFAWLAWAHQKGIPASNPAVTGARGARLLGAHWPA